MIKFEKYLYESLWIQKENNGTVITLICGITFCKGR